MAIPTTPTWTATISAAMISAGQLNVSYAQVSNMAARGAQDVLTELWAASRYDVLLTTETVVLVNTGTTVLPLPANFDHEQSLFVYAGSNRDRAQTGNNQAITLASADSAGDSAYVGYLIFLLAGTGSGQVNQIIDYTSSTKIASLTSAWATNPDSTSDYLIATLNRDLLRWADDAVPVTAPGLPAVYRITGYQLTVWPPAAHIYPLRLTYAPNLTMLDNTGTPFIKWLKERMALVKQGIKVQTMLLFDDDRYTAELLRWEQMKLQYGGQNPTYGQVQRSR